MRCCHPLLTSFFREPLPFTRALNALYPTMRRYRDSKATFQWVNRMGHTSTSKVPFHVPAWGGVGGICLHRESKKIRKESPALKTLLKETLYFAPNVTSS